MTTTKTKSLCLRRHEVLALLVDGRVTVVRVVKPQPAYPGVAKISYDLHPFAPSTLIGTPAEGVDIAKEEHVWNEEDWCGNIVGVLQAKCPFGKIGDQLIGKEKFGIDTNGANQWVVYEDMSRGPDCTDKISHAEAVKRGTLVNGFDWRSAATMSPWASRLGIEVAAVQCKRLNAITEDEAKAAGMTEAMFALDGKAYQNAATNAFELTKEILPGAKFARSNGMFASMWNRLHGPAAWASNPWVWIGDLRRVEG